jgi:uncharacterized protein
MNLHKTDTSGLLSITGYDAHSIAVNGRNLTRSFILTPQQLIEDWPPVSLAALTMDHLMVLASLNSPIVLLGTGQRQQFPSPAVLRPLLERRIGVEVMDSFAACRTYNILMAEGRDVAAAIIFDQDA